MSTPRPELPTLGRYQVIEEIAAGGMAEVFLARAVGAMGFQRLVAVKLIHSNFTRDPEFVKMFIDEARIAMHLHHRNIVQVFDLDEINGTYFLAMEYVRGVNLYSLYERIAQHGRWLDVPIALYLVAEICKGLHFAHTRTGADGRPLGIIHRDISPQNILLSYEGEVKITDFGIATAAERLHETAAGIVKGKYAYMAPERLSESPTDARVDVFSAGVLLYELLVGENPFAGASAVETIEAVLAGRVAKPSARGAHAPSRLDEICLQALALDPAERFPSAQALGDALTELAMELTYARKDMASGDAALAALLADLFPAERARKIAPQPVSIPAPPPEPDDFDDDLDDPTVLRASSASFEPDPTAPTRVPDAVTGDGVDGDGGAPTVQTPAVSREQLQVHLRAMEIEDVDAATVNERFDTPYAHHALGADATVDAPAGNDDTWLPTSAPPLSWGASAAVSDPADKDGPTLSTSNDLSSSDLSLRPTPRWSRWLAPLLGLLAVVVALGVGGWWVLLGQTGSALVVRVPLRVSTRPPGATVYVDEIPLPAPTPTDTTVLAQSRAIVRLELEGYQASEHAIEPNARRAINLDVDLRPETPAPSLEVVPARRTITLEAPRGRWAHIYLDGEDLGATPVTTEVPVGLLKVVAQPREGGRRLELELEVPSDGPDRFTLRP